MRHDGVVNFVPRVLVFRTFLVQSRDLVLGVSTYFFETQDSLHVRGN